MTVEEQGHRTILSGRRTDSVKDGSASINNTWYHRFLVLAAIVFLSRFRPRRGMIILLTGTLCVKYGPLRHLPEASTMKFIARNTSIPVPKIHCAFTRKGWTYIVMERVRGESIAHGWKSRSAVSKAKILQQLKEMVDSMRRLSPSSPAVANIVGGRMWDCRLPEKSPDFGPFDNINSFHQHLRGGLNDISEGLPTAVNELIQLHDRKWPAPVLTHADLSSLNIMAEGDTITGIVDWETAGWYPYY